MSQYYYEELLKSSVDELGPEHPTVIDYAKRLLEINEGIRHMNNEGNGNNNINASMIEPSTSLSVNGRTRTSSQSMSPQGPST